VNSVDHSSRKRLSIEANARRASNSGSGWPSSTKRESSLHPKRYKLRNGARSFIDTDIPCIGHFPDVVISFRTVQDSQRFRASAPYCFLRSPAHRWSPKAHHTLIS
jgi:hypothetical protein